MSTLRNIRIFLSVYDTLSISKSAKALYLTQPAVSRAILDLETEYGVLLFDRGNHRLVSTRAGDLFYTHALQIAGSYDALAKSLDEYDKCGSFTLGATISLANEDLFHAIQSVKADYPGTHIRLIADSGDTIYEKLKNNEVDFALIEGFNVQSDFETKDLKCDRLVAVLPAGHPLAGKEALQLTEIATEPLLLRGPLSFGHSVVETAFASAGIVPDVFCESSSVTVILRMITEGFGISILPEELVREAADSGRVVTKEIAGDGFLRTNRLLYRKGNYFNQPAARLIDLLTAGSR